MSRYLVTGGTGFLGRYLVEQLSAADHEVVALCRSESSALADLGATIHVGDVLDGGSIRDAATDCDGLFHCAGKVSRDGADAESMYRVHVDGTKTTLDAARSAGIKRAVVASTSGVVAVSSDPDELRDEEADTPMAEIARWPYYRSKLFAERAAFDRNDPQFEVIAVNPSLLLGPGDLRNSSTDDIRLFLERKIPFCPAGGIAFVDARDAAAALILAMEKGKAGERYLVNAANMTVQAFFGRLERISGVKAPPFRLPRTSATIAGVSASLLGKAAKLFSMEPPLDKISAEMSQFYWYCDSTKAETELGWTCRDPNETLADTVEDLEARGVVWPRQRARGAS
ncbi:MAG: NAD-dependent epimerase/dehydratase family protein [Polyangiaceae bacterium]